MDRIFLQAVAEVMGIEEHSAEEVFELCWSHYYPGKLTAAEAIRYLEPVIPRDLAKLLFLSLANLEMLRYFVEVQGMKQAQYDEMREHLQALTRVSIRFHARQFSQIYPASRDETCGLSSERGTTRQAGQQETGYPAHDAWGPQDGPEDGDRTYLEALLDKGVEILEDQAISCAAAYQSGVTAEEATRHISSPYRRDVVRRRLLDLMNIQRAELLVIPTGFTQAQFEELCDHLRWMEGIYARYRASLESNPN